MSTTFRFFKSCSTVTTVCGNRAGIAAQKGCKRRVPITSPTSHYSTTTRLPETDATFPSSTKPLTNGDRMCPLYTHTSQRPRSFSYKTSSSTSSQGRSEVHPAFTNETSEELARHLNKMFGRALVFPPELATRLLTHASHPASKLVGHNARFAFTGRRILHAYFLMFLHSCPNLNPGANYEKIASNALNTYTLGEHVGREWGIGRVLKWKSMVDPQVAAKGVDNVHVGLHKVLGTTVEAIAGGVYHQFGATEAHKFFHTHLLPHILLKGTPQGVPDVYHSRAMQLYKSVNGGVNLSSSQPAQ